MKNDAAYNNVDHIPNGEGYTDRWSERAREFRELEAALGRARLNDAYGPEIRQKTDFFHPAGKPVGLVVFVHGGYWMEFDRTYWSHLAAGPTSRGWAVAMPSYTLAPQARISDITREIAAAISHASGRVAGPVRLTGHSAGGHLVSRMVCLDVGLAAGVRERLESIVPISPVSDLRPFLETSMNETLRLDADEAERESPALLETNGDVSTTVWVGADERPAFLDQARWLAAAWPHSDLVIEPKRHHFDVIEGLSDPDSRLTRTVAG